MNYNQYKLTAVVVVGIFAGILVGASLLGSVEWKYTLSPLAILVSVFAATIIATKNIDNSREIDLKRSTLEYLKDFPSISAEVMAFAENFGGHVIDIRRNVVTDTLIQDDFELLRGAFTLLDEDERTKADELSEVLSYMDTLFSGLKNGYYDKDIALDRIGTFPLLIWRLSWPILRYIQLKDIANKNALNIVTTEPSVLIDFQGWAEDGLGEDAYDYIYTSIGVQNIQGENE